MFGAFNTFGKLGAIGKAIAAAWSPSALYAASQVGAWYDPSDLSTMFTDAAGTTPVVQPGTVADQPVGLILDKSPLGIDASQSTSTARPLLSARVNLLTSTEDLSTSSWNASNNVTRSTNTITATGTDNVQVAQNTGARSGEKITATFKIKKGMSFAILATDAASGGNTAGFDGTTGAYFASGSLNGVYPLVSYSCVTDADPDYWLASATFTSNTFGTSNVGVIINKNKVSSWGWSGCCSIGDVLEFGDVKQYESGSTATAYQRVTTASDYDGTPGKFPYYLKFDGVDDYLSTAAIDFTGTDKVTVFAGVNIASNGDYSGIVEFGPQLATDTGGFLIWARAAGADGKLQAYTKYWTGYVSVDAALAPPQTFIPTIQYDLAASSVATEIIIRMNGASVATTAGGSPTSGVFGNLPLGIGLYNSGYFFNGSLYSLIIAGALYDAATIGEAETWVAGKTGVTL